MIFENSAVAVVSGGASGLGAATARKLSEMGARVVVFDLNIQSRRGRRAGAWRSVSTC